ncbi:pentatricopeptide repeat-containing protein At3g18970-like [Euphorbia lathyris]|uniref:pentatricopeptide repeat-containing protein At3g18970-like n=1 Tax=Euphorbia lathyris TaxID=212925 RepID=UPI0033141B33
MPTRNVVTWNAVITGYTSQREKAKQCAFDGLMLFREMLIDVCGEKPNDTIMVCVLSAISQLGMLEIGVCIHGYIEMTTSTPENNMFIGTRLVDMYSKCRCLDNAYAIFVQMNVKNVLTWTTMATGLAIHGREKESFEILDAMMTSGVKPNAVTFTRLFSACCHSGLVEEGLHLFNNMRGSYGVEPQIQHYGCVVDLLGRAGHLGEAYELIRGMPVKPDAILWRSLLSACQVHGDFVLGEKIAKILLALAVDLEDSVGEDYMALSNVYSFAERWEDVEMVRKEIKVKRVETKTGASFVHGIGN